MVRYSPLVPRGGVCGGTWSKNGPFSSQVMNSAVFAHSFGLEARVRRMWSATCSPERIENGGWSLCMMSAYTQDTWGSSPAATSASKSSGKRGLIPRAFRYGSEKYCLNIGNGESVVTGLGLGLSAD